METLGYAAMDEKGHTEPYRFNRRALRKDDIAIDIKYCGVCHSDLHQARSDWSGSVYPVVPGHEIVGIVSAVGDDVSDFSIGDKVAVGCMVDSCLSCSPCKTGEEQFCAEGATLTYNSPDRETGENTLGGYSNKIVVRKNFVLRVPEGLDLARTGPILCAGITTYSPLKKWNISKGSKVGVVGLGGLGHMAVKLAVGMGAEVTVISRSRKKEEDALKLGAKRVVVSTDQESMSEAQGSLEFILDTVPVAHPIDNYLSLLSIDGSFVIVGAIDDIPAFHSINLLLGRKRVSGSIIGGIAETQELLDLCAEKSIYPECEMIKIQDINQAFERMEKGDVKYRFVIDMSSLE